MKSESNQKATTEISLEIPEKILAIWGRSILSSGWTTVPNELLRNQSKLGLGNTEMMLVIHLISFVHNADSKVFPSIELLCERMNQDRRTIQRTLNKLEIHNVLRKKVRSTGKSDKGMTNLYDLTPLMLKLINLQLPSLNKPIEQHTCPMCGKTATSKEEIEKEFGFRQDKGKVRIQSWCRSCRGKKREINSDVIS